MLSIHLLMTGHSGIGLKVQNVTKICIALPNSCRRHLNPEDSWTMTVSLIV